MAEDGVLTSSNGYLNHELAKKVAHVIGFGKDRVAELRSLLGKVDGDALRIVGIGAGAWGSVFITLLQDAYGALRDSVQVGKHISHSPAFVLFSLFSVGAQRCSSSVQSLLCNNREQGVVVGDGA
jgi:hypothetical protein